MILPKGRQARAKAFTLTETLVALGVFAMATLGIWEIIRTNFFLAAKNTGVNLSHTTLQTVVDRLANDLRGSLQIVDVANFNGSTFSAIAEATAGGSSAAGNAVRFVRVLPVTLYLMPDDGSLYSLTNPEDPKNLLYPDYLTPGNKTVKVVFNTATSNLSDPNFLADIAVARLFPRFPYITETVTSGPNLGKMPGMDVVGSPLITGGNTALIPLVYGLPAADKTKASSSTNLLVPSCNQAYMVVVSAFAVINHGTAYAELLYYPDAGNLARSVSLTQALQSSQTGANTTSSGPAVFGIPATAGAPSDPSKRAALNINLPVYAPDLNNTVARRGGTASLTNIEINVPVEVRRRALF